MKWSNLRGEPRARHFNNKAGPSEGHLRINTIKCLEKAGNSQFIKIPSIL